MAGKYVLDGAKIKCPLCSKKEGKLKVTSNKVQLQDKPAATEGDNGKPNLQFQGNCTHPQFSGGPPPPCKSVISVVQWQNTSETKFDDQKALVEGSTIMCQTGGVPITIKDTTQKATPTNLAAMDAAAAPIPGGSRQEPQVTDAYWVDKNGNRTTLLPYGEKARIRIKTEHADSKQIAVQIFESDWGVWNDDNVHEFQWTIENKDLVYAFDLTPDMFVRGEEDIVNLYFAIKIADGETNEFCNSNSEYLKVHLVNYIPSVMEELAWAKGAALQEEWFSRPGSQQPGANRPVTTIITMDWVLGFARANQLYERMINQEIWTNTAGKAALVEELKRMRNNNQLAIPETANQSADFGVFASDIITYEGSKVPRFDKYHYQERAFQENAYNATDEDLDDLYAALANFVFRMAAGGTITRKYDHYRISISRVATYVRDSFNFIDAGWNAIMSQPLGYWNISENEASTENKEGFRYINNDSYNDYRNEFGKGGDFLVFSDLKYIDTDDQFDVPLDTF